MSKKLIHILYLTGLLIQGVCLSMEIYYQSVGGVLFMVAMIVLTTGGYATSLALTD